MRILDYYYKEYLKTALEGLGCLVYDIGQIFFQICNWILCITFFVTMPLWIIPYKIWERKNAELVLRKIEEFNKE